MTDQNRRRLLGGLALSAGAAALLAEAPRGHAAEAAAATLAGESQAPPLAQVSGRTAYVTGGNTGIGLGICRALYNAGMNIVMGYIDEKALPAALAMFPKDDPRVLPLRHDVTDRDGWQTLLTVAKARFGKLHLLVNNAGIKTLRKASEASARDWDLATAVNFTGIHNGVAACVPHFLQHGEGAHIVTTASMGGLLPGSTAGVYTATKFAAVGLMEALRIELRATSVGTSVFCPGLVTTDHRSPEELAAEAAALKAQAEKEGRPYRAMFAGMDPLEAGERVLNGVRHNDLFILSHTEFKAGLQERFDAILASMVSDEAPPASRVAASRVVLTAPSYGPEIVHRRKARQSYRG
jgi:NAD(P)-dependent dehydrogenase (short-subunit alcohol dehydrogenase family)